VQWVQLYEFSPELLASVMAALRPVFSDYVTWLSNDGDLIIVAANGGRVPEPRSAALAQPAIAEVLARFHVRNLDDLNVHRLGSRRTMDAYFRSFGAEPNSDFFPVIDLGAAKARFMRTRANGPVQLVEAPLPLLDLFEPGYLPDARRLSPGERVGGLRRVLFSEQAERARDYLVTGNPKSLEMVARNAAGALVMLRGALVECRVELPEGIAVATMSDFARLINAFLPPEEAKPVWERLGKSPCSSRLDARDRRWLELHAAVAAREAGRMGDAAAAILETSPNLAPDTKAYVLAALMAGHIVSGQPALALKAFQVNRGGLRGIPEWQPVFSFLIEHASGPILGQGQAQGDSN
jgi:spermidine synthase